MSRIVSFLAKENISAKDANGAAQPLVNTGHGRMPAWQEITLGLDPRQQEERVVNAVIPTRADISPILANLMCRLLHEAEVPNQV